MSDLRALTKRLIKAGVKIEVDPGWLLEPDELVVLVGPRLAAQMGLEAPRAGALHESLPLATSVKSALLAKRGDWRR